MPGCRTRPRTLRQKEPRGNVMVELDCSRVIKVGSQAAESPSHASGSGLDILARGYLYAYLSGKVPDDLRFSAVRAAFPGEPRTFPWPRLFRTAPFELSRFVLIATCARTCIGVPWSQYYSIIARVAEPFRYTLSRTGPNSVRFFSRVSAVKTQSLGTPSPSMTSVPKP